MGHGSIKECDWILFLLLLIPKSSEWCCSSLGQILRFCQRTLFSPSQHLSVNCGISDGNGVCWFMGSVKLWEEEIGLLGSWVQMPDFMQSHLFPFFFPVQATSFSSFYNVWMGKDLGNPVVWSLLQKGKGLTQESPEDTEWVNGKTMIWSQVGVLVGLFNSPFHSSAFGSPSLRYMVRYLIKDTQSMFLHSCQNRSVYLTWDLHPYQKVNVSLVLGYVPVLPALGWQKQEAKVNGLLLLLCVAE